VLGEQKSATLRKRRIDKLEAVLKAMPEGLAWGLFAPEEISETLDTMGQEAETQQDRFNSGSSNQKASDAAVPRAPPQAH
jgi:hypothetical protein